MKANSAESGFTLIEMIAVLIILGIMAVFLTNAIVYGVQAYIFARDADQLSQKAQLAMARINGELTDITAVSVVSADQIDYTSPRNPPSCNSYNGCQYSLKRTGNQITLERTSAPIVTAQILLDGLTTNNGGNNFLGFFRSDGMAWTTVDGFSNNNGSNANYLATIQVRVSLNMPSGGNLPVFSGTINPRANGISTVPQPN